MVLYGQNVRRMMESLRPSTKHLEMKDFNTTLRKQRKPDLSSTYMKTSAVQEMLNHKDSVDLAIELKRLSDLRASYRQNSIDNKQRTEELMNQFNPDVYELKGVINTLTNQMHKIRELDSQIQRLVKKDPLQWRKEISAAVDFNLLWSYYMQDLRSKRSSVSFSSKSNTTPIFDALSELSSASSLGARSYY